MLELPDDPPGPELDPGLAEGTLLPPGDGMLEFPADIPLLPPGPAVLPEFPELPPGPEVLPGFTVVIPFPPGADRRSLVLFQSLGPYGHLVSGNSGISRISGRR